MNVNYIGIVFSRHLFFHIRCLMGMASDAPGLEMGPCTTQPSEKRQGDVIQVHHAVLPKRKKRERRVDASRIPERRVEASVPDNEQPCSNNSADKFADCLDLEALLKYYTGQDKKYEYLDHTADVQLHAWGDELKEAFEQVALCMFNYMTPMKGIVEKLMEKKSVPIEKSFVMKGNDMESLMFHWLDELLFQFSTEFFVPVKLDITELDLNTWTIKANGIGDTFNSSYHTCGTEVKAITYSAMQIYDTDSPPRSNAKGKAECFVIVDI